MKYKILEKLGMVENDLQTRRQHNCPLSGYKL